MSSTRKREWNRREFLCTTGTLAATGIAVGAARGVSIASDPADAVASAAPARWAAKELHDSLAAHGIVVHHCERAAQSAPGDLTIVAAGFAAPVAGEVIRGSGVRAAAVSEALALIPGRVAGREVLLAAGHDTAGLVYALLELADRVHHANDPLAALAAARPVAERPANTTRSVMRMFTSDVEDKPWFNDRDMWPPYLTMLAGQRFNRFNLSFGIGYDFLRDVRDAYFLFTYPFLMMVPGYNVRVPQLPDAERDRNLEMLKYISEQTAARGMQFQLGLWMHGYEWLASPHPNYTIEGLTKANHGAYCRDAVCALLKALPAVSGVTFRVHGESGVEEGSYEFWKAVFQGVAQCGRKVEIDMHAKGMDQTMMDMAVATGLPVKISPKYWAEHMGMPYHQADIRELEQPKEGRQATGLMKFSAGSRSFLRYGYGDLLRDDRKWDVLHRIWPGTQRLLVWGDPLTAAAYSRAFSFCGSAGVEIMEPLGFKGRRGSGIAGDRCAYADASLKPRWDWLKYLYSHRVWGRLLYNPDTDPDGWQRYLAGQFGVGGRAVEAALANASRILPVVTTAHGASAGNNTYWPEVYLNQSLGDGAHPGPYTDTPAPKVFGNVSPLDPQLFSRINDYADELLAGEGSGKYSPIEVAQWIEDYAAAGTQHLAEMEAHASGRERPEYRRLAIDIAIQCGLGRFFGARFRSAVLYRIYEKTGDRTALEESLRAYRGARSAWAELAAHGKVYKPDITVGELPQLRGHWLDRLPAMDQDIAAVVRKLEQAKDGSQSKPVAAAIQAALAHPHRAAPPCRHTPPAHFTAGRDVALELAVEKRASTVLLHYRHVTQAERWVTVSMEPHNQGFVGSIPGPYADSPYPLEYYFELKFADAPATLHPGFGPGLTSQPYFLLRRA